jgi:murein DD-endopeptidase MepM/ murein hydrolase activator NlpD
MKTRHEVMAATARHCHDFLGNPRRRNLLLAVGAAMIVAGLALPSSDAVVDAPATPTVKTLTLPEPAVAQGSTRSRALDADALRQAVLERPAAEAETAAIEDRSAAIAADSAAAWQTVTVGSGDNLAAVFDRVGLTPRDVHNVVNAGDPAGELTRIYPGDNIHLRIDDNGELGGVRYRMDETRTLRLEHTGEGAFDVTVETATLQRRTAEAQGTIKSSLYNAALDAGLNDRLIMELAGIFGWDIDFALDIRAGDRFVVVYEELYRDGEKIRNGNILAAEFINRGEPFRALRYETAEGESNYYAPDGRSMRKAFLRTPTDFTRVSSEFNPNRIHPVYGTKRPHRGTDYAAPPGTPIKAAGDGKIIHRGTKGGYGKTVVLKHGSRYTTLYAHMRSYARGQSTGDRVKQGEIIGYVGSTGLSTGPHLHYEFRVNGVHRNPRTVDLPEAEPIAERYRADFERTTAALVTRLDTLSGTRLAQADD